MIKSTGGTSARKKIIVLVVLGMLFMLGIINQRQLWQLIQHDARQTNSNQYASDTGEVARVVDGDTIVLTTGEKIRYIGIDTPETVNPKKEIECFGKEASLLNKELVEGKRVRLEKDISQTDAYGRLLRFVYVQDETGAEVLVNRELVLRGFARIQTVPPDVAYAAELKQAQEIARTTRRGLWSSCR
ncbi:MAG: hypothetical protein RIQ54_499 [Candidatus Parcubacteria bacterium]|jgi:micrococcal nuclease